MATYTCKKHGLVTHDGGYYLGCGCPATTDNVIPSQEQIRGLLDARKHGCICREFIGRELKIESGCPVHDAKNKPQP